jgi:DNA polymerase type B, organellar and viral
MARSITLSRGGRCSLPSVVVFVDCEPCVTCTQDGTGSKIHSFGAGYASSCRLRDGQLVDKACISFKKPWMFWKLLDDVKDSTKATWVFGHNIGYDLRLLGFWDWLPASGAELVNSVLEDPPTIITVRLGRRLIKFVDVMNYWRLSLVDLARGVSPAESDGLRRPPGSAYEPGNCQRDVEVIESCVLRLIGLLSDTQCCSLRTTAAAVSWATFIKCFLTKPLSISQDLRARSLERKAYFGGRVSCIASGLITEPVIGLDCNSLYPSVMSTNLYPCRLISHPCGLRPAELKAALRYYDAVAECSLCGGEYPYPMRTSAGVDFVRGCPTAILAGDELRTAINRCDVTKIRDCYIYERADLFSGFVKHFFAAKTAATAAGNRADVILYKMMLNSLHGKFGQKGRQWTPAPGVMARDYYDYWWHKSTARPAPVRMRSVAGNVEAKEIGRDPRHCFPAISAAITANARVVLENDIQSAGPHNVLYCDTDSLHTLSDGQRRLARVGRLDGTALGSYRTVVSGQSAHYYGRQHYRIGNHTVCSSIKPTAQEIADGVYLQDAMMGIERSLETGVHSQVIVSRRIVDMSGRSRDARRTLA